MILATDDLRFFVRLVEAGSISETARRLHSSPPAVSRRLAALEHRLGVRLIDRSSRRFVPTEEGNLLAERAIRIVGEIDGVEAELLERRGEPQGLLRVGAPMEIGRRRLAPLIATFQRLYPKVACELVLSDAGDDPMRDELDLALRTTLPDDPSALCSTLLRSRRVVCATPAYFAQYGMPLDPTDLTQHECLRLVRGRRVFDHWRFHRVGQPFEVRVTGPLASTSSEVIHDWALCGQGIALKAGWDIVDDLREGRLIECLNAFSNDPIHLYGVFAAHARQPLRLRVLIDFMREQLVNVSTAVEAHL